MKILVLLVVLTSPAIAAGDDPIAVLPWFAQAEIENAQLGIPRGRRLEQRLAELFEELKRPLVIGREDEAADGPDGGQQKLPSRNGHGCLLFSSISKAPCKLKLKSAHDR